MQITLTPLADAGVEVLPPDIVWTGTSGDFALSKGGESGPAGGLHAANPLATAVMMLLFSDARAETWELRQEHQGDRRGWVGDGFDVDVAAGEAPLGSKLWLYRRHELTDLTALEIAAEAERALQPLVRQGAVVTIKTAAEVEKAEGRIRLKVNLYGRDGREAYADRFDVLWRRVDGGL